MQLIAQAWKDLQDRQFLVFCYVGVHGLLFLAVGLLEWALGVDLSEETIPPAIAALNLVDQLFLAAAVAALQAVVFSRLGKDIDKPLWKCADDAEAIRRFFLPWFLINLGFTVISELQRISAARELAEVYGLLEYFQIFYLLVSIPIGACIMYWGRFEWGELGEALRPITRQFQLVLSVFLLQLGQFIMSMMLRGALFDLEPTDIKFVITVALGIMPLTLIELLAFVTMWQVLMINRDTPDDDGDDFDF